MCIWGGDREGPESPIKAHGEGPGEASGRARPAGEGPPRSQWVTWPVQALTGPDIRLLEGQ